MPWPVVICSSLANAGSPAALAALLLLALRQRRPQRSDIGPLALVAIMYFLMIRPQMKRAKEHRAMLEALSKGDEVLTNGGLAGVVTDIGDNFITIEVAENVRIRVQKGAVGNVLPKGTLKAI